MDEHNCAQQIRQFLRRQAVSVDMAAIFGGEAGTDMLSKLHPEMQHLCEKRAERRREQIEERR